jgi:predicted GNAT family N-acyltransferase
MVRIEKFKFEDKERIRQSNVIRTKVFIEEQHVDPEIEYEFEAEGNYYLLFYNENAVATARWRNTEKGIKLERFAMLKEFRNQGLGKKLLDALLSDVIPFRKKIYLHSQVVAINFYRRSGFLPEGEHFWEADIEHLLMTYQDPT